LIAISTPPSMSLTLTTHDTRFDDPDAETIASVLGALDGRLHVMATLGHSELRYLQATGSASAGLSLEHQEGSLDRHYRCRTGTLPLGLVTELFQKYARGDDSWRQAVPWEHVPYVAAKTPWHSTWVGLSVILLVIITLIWLWRGP
jgi:hypothetical protein